MIISKKNGELLEMGEPIKETQSWLIFEKGKTAKHTLPRLKATLKQFNQRLVLNKYQPINNTIN
jgi:hypothetical protein